MKQLEAADLNGRALLQIDGYEDLLRVRGLAEWSFVSEDPPIVATDPTMLHAIGLDATEDHYRWPKIAPHLFDYQRWVIERALERERFAAFLTTGLGKTAIQLEWARLVTKRHSGRTLIVAPLNIIAQTIEEAERFYTRRSMSLVDLRSAADLARWLHDGRGIGITNYEKIDRADSPIGVQAVVLDESSILKNCNGARRHALVHAFRGVRWKLACSATPAPNDRVEYAEHAYWLEVVRSTREFLAAYFVNRDGTWQLKAHGVDAFYRHLASWSVFMVHPDAFRFTDATDRLPPLDVQFPEIDTTPEQVTEARVHETGDQPSLFGATPGGITSRTKMLQIANGFLYSDDGVRRFPAHKPEWIAKTVNGLAQQCIVWVKFDEEGDELARLIPDAVHLSGRTPMTVRDETVEAFRHGNGSRVLILKPSMFGFGLNLQACNVQVFSSLDDSFERYFQCVRRSWRFGQTEPVTVLVPQTPFDKAMTQNVLNKQETYETDARRQEAVFVNVLRPWDQTERNVYVGASEAERDRASGDNWTMVLGDSILHMEEVMDPQSMDLAIFSPPFANLFTYSAHAADMGNVRSDAEYRLQWKWFAERLLRVMRPGRIVAVHCMDIIRFAGQHGYRHTYDYPSDLRAGLQDAGFIYKARISIDKNPQLQATRTKDHNLLFVTLTRDALNSHSQAGEYVLIFSTPGESETPVIASDVSNQEWITWAHHIWYDIRETDVLNAALAREEEDERHICPLQLGLIERCVRIWSNPGETVFSPFAGIGSEGYEALAHDRRFYGVELKQSYFETACRFLSERERQLASRLPFAQV